MIDDYDYYAPYYERGTAVAHFSEDYKNKRRKHPVGFAMPKTKKRKKN